MNSSTNNTLQSNPYPERRNASDNLFDFNRIIRLVLKNWYLFLISFPLCIGSVFLYHRYSVPVYKATATIMLKGSEQPKLSQADLMEGFGLSPEMRSVENQSFILRSKKIVKKTIDRLDFGVSYFQKGRFKDTELYSRSPFYLEFDSLHPQLINVPIEILFLPDQRIKVVVETESGWLHSYAKDKFGGQTGPLSYEKIVQEGEWLTEKEFSFCIKRKPNINLSPNVNYHCVFKSHNQLANEFRGVLSVTPYSEGSSILFVSSTGTSRSKIIRFLDTLCEVILEHNLNRKNDMATRSIRFIETQLEMVSDTLDKVQNRLSNYRKTNRFMGPSEFSQKLADKYYDTESELKMLEMRIEYYEYLKKNISQSTDVEQFMLPALSNESSGLVTELVTQLVELQKELELIKNSAQHNNQYVVAVQSRVEVTADLLNKAINQVLRNCKMDKKKIEREMTAILSDMEKLPELEKDYLLIDRTYKLNDAIYTFLLQKHSETQISKASNTPDNEIIDNASISALVSPQSNSNYKKGIILALLIPAVFIGLKEFLNTRVRGKEDLKHLLPDVPVVGMIMHDVSGVENVIHDKPHSVVSESFRSLRTKLKFMGPNQEFQVISLTSSDTGEGKTFCAHNLASVLAISGKKTVLVGFDMRKPRLTALFNLQGSAGLSNYYIGDNTVDEIVYPTAHGDVSVIPSGPIPPNPSELIVSERTGALFTYLRQAFDVIVVDSPPVGLVADARLLMNYSDCNLFVVRANYTSKEHMLHTVEGLVMENVNNLGLVLNDVSNDEKVYGKYSAEYYGGKAEV